MNWRSWQNSVAVIFLTFGVTIQPSLAQSNSSPTRSVDCQNATTTPEINQCARREFVAADKQLNQLYQQIIARSQGSPKRTQLINAQQAWIKYRDAACAFERLDGGTAASYSYTFCRARITRQRVADFEDYLRR